MYNRTSGTPRAGNAALALIATVALVLPLAASAQQLAGQAQEATAGQTFELRYTATFAADDLVFGQVLGYDRVTLPDGGILDKPGWPMLPTQYVRIAVPEGMAVTGVRVLGLQTVELPGQYDIFPAQPPLHVSQQAKPEDFVKPNAAAYAAEQLYPVQVAEFTDQSDLAGQAMAGVRFCPLQYVAATKQLFLHTSVEIVLEGTDGYVCGDYLPARISDEGRAEYESMVTGMVVNPEDVRLCEVPAGVPQTMGVAAGTYDYVIITISSWEDDFEPLAEWKHKKGRPAKIVTTNWIYYSGGYSGGNGDKIRAFVQDAHNTWGTTAFLIGADTNNVPVLYDSYNGDSIPNDTSYADFDDDWVCEVNVGRAPVRTTTQIASFIDKVLTYEKTPPTSSYPETAFFCGFDLYTSGSGEGQGCKAAIDMAYIPDDWDFRREYDGESGTHKSDVISYLNQGNNLVNHIDHSSTNYMGTGYTNHGEGLGNSDMSALTNGDRQSILYTIGCWACDYNSTTCIAEAFVQNTNGGGLAFVGNSRYGWYSPYNDDYYSLRYDRYFFRSLFTQYQRRIGACFSDHKNDAYQGGDTSKYIFIELTLLGDPEVPVWTDTIQTLSVSHPSLVSVGVPNTFNVQVSSGGDPVYDSPVCLWKDGDIYEKEYTNTSGVASFTITPGSTGTMYVTVTGFNYLPYEGSASVTTATNYTLTTYTSGSGDIDLDPPGGTYTSGTWVECTADPDTGWHFDHWEDDLTGSTNPDDIQMTSNKTVTAVFAQDQYTLTVNVSGSGSVVKNPNQSTYTYGQNVELTAYANAGWHFDHWENDLTGSTNPDYVYMNGNKTVTAVFVQDQYTLTINITGSGSVVKNPDQSTYTYGQNVQLTAYGDTGWDFDHWEDDLTGSTNPDYIYMNGNKTVTAVFVENTYTLTVYTTGQGSVTLDPPGGTYAPGTWVDLDAESDSGWCFDQWTGDVTGTTNPESIQMNGDYTVTAVFAQPCTVGLGDMNCDGDVNNFDIDPFVLALNSADSGFGAYYAVYPDCDGERADCNGDGDVNNFDIDAFIALIT